jgi:PAS domain S-box-containing protein
MEKALHENEEARQFFSERLTRVLDAINELSRLKSFDELCRRSVELAIERLGFDRVGLCFLSEDQQTVLGSYGTDEEGHLRNEKHLRRPVEQTPTVKKLLKYPEPVLFFEEEVLYNDKLNHVGVGNHAVARLWNGEKITGIYAVDNLIHKNPITDEDLKILVLYGTAMGHLFRLKQTEEALRESENRFRTLFEQAAVGVAQIDTTSGKFFKVNQRFCTIIGYSSEELQDLTLLELTHSADIETEQKKMQSLAEGKIREYSVDKRLRHKSGLFIWVNQTTSTMQSIGDGQKYNIVVVQDITGRKRAEEALLESSTFNQHLVETMPFGIDIVDENGTILFVNNTMKALLKNDVLGQECWSMYKDDKKQCADCPLRRGIEFGKPNTLEVDGVLGGKTYQISHVGMMHRGRKSILEVFQDITEQKKLHNELFQAQKLQSIGTLAGGIAHDFNNILCIILAYVSSMRRSKQSLGNNIESLNSINQAVQRGAALVRQVLTFARKTENVFEVIDINSLVLELLSMLKRTFPKIITFSEQLEKNLPFIFADHSQVHQTILNLCVNARDAIPYGGTITVKTESLTKEKVMQKFPSASSDVYICISVIDTGEGIDETTRQKVFDPFFTTKEKGRGTGLGLSVVYGIMQAHEGFIDLESTRGQGSTFRLYFPVPETIDDSRELLKSMETYDIGGTEIILFVEDEDLLLETVSVMLESHGYTLFTAKDGREAIEMYKRYHNQIDLVITDMGLPVMTGVDEFRTLKMLNPDIKIILASGSIEPELRSELLSQGVSDIIQKPYRLDDILRKIRDVLDKK